MDGVSYLSALLLAATFLVAGVAKLRAPAATAAGMAALGLPGAATLARAVPVVELALAVALVVWPAAGATAALALLAAFTTLLARTLLSGTQVRCGCFGAAGDAPVSFVEIVRNGLLAGLAAVALLADGPVRPQIEDVILTTTAALTGLVVLALCRVKRDLGVVWDNTLPGEAVAP